MEKVMFRDKKEDMNKVVKACKNSLLHKRKNYQNQHKGINQKFAAIWEAFCSLNKKRKPCAVLTFPVLTIPPFTPSSKLAI